MNDIKRSVRPIEFWLFCVVAVLLCCYWYSSEEQCHTRHHKAYQMPKHGSNHFICCLAKALPVDAALRLLFRQVKPFVTLFCWSFYATWHLFITCKCISGMITAF